jgi:hypothetical protein
MTKNLDEEMERDELILNFRTITTIINVLQRAPPGLYLEIAKQQREYSNALWDPNLAPTILTRTSVGSQRELQMLDALATLLVRDNEKVAVMHKGPSRQCDGELGVDFVVCINLNQVSHSLPIYTVTKFSF